MQYGTGMLANSLTPNRQWYGIAETAIPRAMKRGRKAKAREHYPNRLQEWLDRRGLSHAALGRRVDMDAQRVWRYAVGERKLPGNLYPVFAEALDIGEEDLLPGGSTTIPVRYAVHAFEAGTSPGELPPPLERIPAPRRLGVPPLECFAAAVEDDSADRRYPAGSTLIVHDIAHARPQLGRAVLVKRHYDREGKGPIEVLVGILQRGVAGDLEVVLPTNNRRLPGLVPIRRRDELGALGDRQVPYVVSSGGAIDYAPADGDEAVILGVVVRVDRPE